MRSVVLGIVAFGAAVVVAGCGGDRQDKNEPGGTFKVEIVKHAFPSSQHLAQKSEMVIAVRNADNRALPNVAVTVNGFSRVDQQPGLADPSRPIWIIDNGPFDATTAYENTWAKNEKLAPGSTATFKWRLTAMHPGTYTVKYKVAAGLDGKAKAALPGPGSGTAPEGSFTVRISGKPSKSTVGDNGQVIRD